MLCNAMHYAHQQKVVHRDIKPANLMINERGELKVGDFGIGRTVADTVNRVTKNSGGGTPPFMSPQQTMGEKASPLDDVYSIGATIYDLVTGDPPFFRGAIREQALAKVPPSLAERRAELGRAGKPIPLDWEDAVASCLAKDPAERPTSALALREILEGKKPAAAKAAKGGRAPLLIGAAVVLVVAGAVAYLKMSPQAPAPGPAKPAPWSPPWPRRRPPRSSRSPSRRRPRRSPPRQSPPRRRPRWRIWSTRARSRRRSALSPACNRWLPTARARLSS